MWLVYAILASLFWGLNYVLAEKIFEKRISPTTLLGIEMMVAGPLMIMLSDIRKEFATIVDDGNLSFLVLGAICSMAIGNYLIATSIKEKNATLAGLIEISYPLFIFLFTYLLFRTNHITLPIACGGMLIMAGVLVIYLYT